MKLNRVMTTFMFLSLMLSYQLKAETDSNHSRKLIHNDNVSAFKGAVLGVFQVDIQEAHQGEETSKKRNFNPDKEKFAWKTLQPTTRKLKIIEQRVENNPPNDAKKSEIEAKSVKFRNSQLNVLQNSADVWVYDASIEWLEDADSDYFYSSLNLVLDVDSLYTTTNIFSEIYYREAGGSWTWLASTQNFEISGQQSNDSYILNLTFNAGFNPDNYDLLIDVYDADSQQFLTTYSSADDVDLSQLPLEDQSWDFYAGLNISLDSYDLSLYSDLDADGYFSGYEFSASVTNHNYARNLQLNLYSRDSQSDWFLELEGAAVWVEHNDQVQWHYSVDLEVNYSPDQYDFLIELVDADTGEFIKDYGPELALLSQRSLESKEQDIPPRTEVTVEYSGGSTSTMFLSLLVLVALLKKYKLPA